MTSEEPSHHLVLSDEEVLHNTPATPEGHVAYVTRERTWWIVRDGAWTRWEVAL